MQFKQQLLIVLIFNGFGFVTSTIQQVVSARIRNSQEISFIRILLELSIFVVSILTFQVMNKEIQSTIISEKCQTIGSYLPIEKTQMDMAFTFL